MLKNLLSFLATHGDTSLLYLPPGTAARVAAVDAIVGVQEDVQSEERVEQDGEGDRDAVEQELGNLAKVVPRQAN